MMKEQIDAETVMEAARCSPAIERSRQRPGFGRCDSRREGWHQAARDLLLHTGTIDPVKQNAGGPSVIVNIGRLVTGERQAAKPCQSSSGARTSQRLR